MKRFTFVVLAALLIGPATAEAELFSGKRIRNWKAGIARHRAANPVPNRYRTPYPTQTAGMSIGVFSYPNYNYPRPGQFDPYRFDNYVHDPTIYGKFQAPDLLNDPYFRERHRYDSHFPGRRYRKGH